MSHIHDQPDRDLHHADASHRSTPATANGAVLARHEKRIRHHLELHAAEDAIREENEREARLAAGYCPGVACGPGCPKDHGPDPESVRLCGICGARAATPPLTACSLCA